MPRPTKAYRRQKINAAAAYKRGDREEAYKLWKQASDSLREARSKKRTRHQPEPEPEVSKDEGGEAAAPAAEEASQDS